MTPEQQKEQFSRAYVLAVAAAAQVNVFNYAVDADSIDIGFAVRSVAGQPQSPRLEAQLKCCTQRLKPNRAKTALRYELKAKNYDELVGPHHVPRILIVVLVPPKIEDWLSPSADELILRKCGYWTSLRGSPVLENDSSVMVDLPTSQLFTPDALKALFAVIRLGGKI